MNTDDIVSLAGGAWLLWKLLAPKDGAGTAITDGSGGTAARSATSSTAESSGQNPGDPFAAGYQFNFGPPASVFDPASGPLPQQALDHRSPNAPLAPPAQQYVYNPAAPPAQLVQQAAPTAAAPAAPAAPTSTHVNPEWWTPPPPGIKVWTTSNTRALAN